MLVSFIGIIGINCIVWIENLIGIFNKRNNKIKIYVQLVYDMKFIKNGL